MGTKQRIIAAIVSIFVFAIMMTCVCLMFVLFGIAPALTPNLYIAFIFGILLTIGIMVLIGLALGLVYGKKATKYLA
jgi:hypothetical protein